MKYAETRFQHNQEKAFFASAGLYDIPIITAETFEPCNFIPFSDVATCRHKDDTGVHFFIDDYRFERVWYNFKRYTEQLAGFRAVMTPDFSTMQEYPVALQIYNHYRKHFFGAYMQLNGLKVYPTICWSDESSFSWCFDGEPERATVCVSSVGTQADAQSRKGFLLGYDAMLERLQPETIVFYGNIPKECRGNIVYFAPFQNKFKM